MIPQKLQNQSTVVIQQNSLNLSKANQFHTPHSLVATANQLNFIQTQEIHSNTKYKFSLYCYWLNHLSFCLQQYF